MKQSKVQKVNQTIEVYKKLLKISKTLHRLDENACNRELTKSEETRGKNLMIQAKELASMLDLFAYNQPDPRGCSLYLVESLKNVDSRYTNGVAIY